VKRISQRCGFGMHYRLHLPTEGFRRLTFLPGVAAAIEFARSGRSMISTFRNWMEPDLRSGALLPVLEEWWPRFEGPMIYFKRKSISAPLRALLNLETRNGRAPA
jgi:DNA-binding transcriptional LysR family regulator